MKYEKTKSVYQQIVQQCPGTLYAGRAQLGAARTNILSLIESGNDAEAQTAIDKLTTDFSGHPGLPEALYDIARGYERAKKYEEAKSIYQQIIQQYPDSSQASKAQVDIPKGQILFSIDIDDGNDTAAQEALDRLIADFPGHSYLPAAVSRTAEQYYNKGNKMKKESLVGQARNYFQKAVTIWEIVINKLPGSIATPQACCWAGDCYTKLGEYEKAMDCYRKVIDGYPVYRFAWHAQFMVGYSYEKLKGSGAITESEADLKTKAAYEQLLKKYPTCPRAEYAKDWLNLHNSK